MSNSEDIGEFHGTEINFADEYHEARRQMGTVGTDMDQLTYHVGLLYLNTPNEKWADAYRILIQEIEMRAELLARI